MRILQERKGRGDKLRALDSRLNRQLMAASVAAIQRISAIVAAAVAATTALICTAAQPNQKNRKQNDDPPRIGAPARILIHNVFLLLWITPYPMRSGGNGFRFLQTFLLYDFELFLCEYAVLYENVAQPLTILIFCK